MKACRGSEDYIHSFLTSALHGDEWSTLSSGRFTPANELRQPLQGGLVGSGAGVDVSKRMKISFLCRDLKAATSSPQPIKYAGSNL